MKNKNSPRKDNSECEEAVRKQTGLSDFIDALDL